MCPGGFAIRAANRPSEIAMSLGVKRKRLFALADHQLPAQSYEHGILRRQKRRVLPRPRPELGFPARNILESVIQITKRTYRAI
jgi:hypothetical protein